MMKEFSAVTILQALILGIIQGLSEFLPISSSGHLVLGQKILGFSSPSIAFDILVHVGTLAAVIIFFRKELIKDIGDFWGNKKTKIFWLVLIGTLPAVVVGFLLNPFLEKVFDSTLIVGFSLIFTSLLLFSTKLMEGGVKKLNSGSSVDGLIIGLFQSLAILPGISRSGSTIVSGLWRGFTRKDAFKLSFYLAIPAILGAQALEIKKLLEVGNGMIASYFIGFIAAMLAGIFSLKVLKKMVLAGKLAYFGIYCFLIGSLTIMFF